MTDNYLTRPVTVWELWRLADLACEEEKAFFRRNPHLLEPYRNRLIAIALCQGAALQYIGRGYGVKDFDVHFFYSQNPQKPRISRAIKQIHTSVVKFQDVPIYYIRTVAPRTKLPKMPRDAVQILQSFLREKPTANSMHLAQKAVICLWPEEIFGERIWPPT